MQLSSFGERFRAKTGIGLLMDDLGLTGCEGDICMLGGGAPARIPQIEQVLRERMARILEPGGGFEALVGAYTGPGGNDDLRGSVATLLSERYGWPLSARNVAVTNGSQSAFFYLLNMFGGTGQEGKFRKVLLPMVPEYVGYADIGLEPGILTSRRPLICKTGDHRFKYRIDFDSLPLTNELGAICVSRPTNPSGNVLTDDEVRHLHQAARTLGIPLILDNAYGLPFPAVVHGEATPFWEEDCILCMSLSKFGIPGARTGIVVASEEVVQILAEMNGVFSLAPGNLGAALAVDLVRSGRIVDLSEQVIRPFYRERVAYAAGLIDAGLAGIPYRLHDPEGAFFLWLWLPELPCTAQDIYATLKQQGVYVLPGHYFFPGMDEDWPHMRQCLRISYTSDLQAIQKGIQALCKAVRDAHG